MHPVQQFLPEALAVILRRAPLSPEKVAFAWRTAVGPSLAKKTTVELRDGVLHVYATDMVWRREVERGSGVIRARLDSLLGEGVVQSMDMSRTLPPQ